MATIPLGEFDRPRVAAQPARSRVDLSGTMDAARAMGDLGRTGMAVGERMMQGEQQRIAQEEQEAKQLARAQATNALLDDEIEQAAIVEDIRSRVADGTLPYASATEELQTRLSTRQPPELSGLDPVGQENFQRGLTRNRFRSTTTVDGIVQTAKRADFKGQVIGMRDRLGKFASDPAADVDQIVASAAQLREVQTAAGMGGTFDKDHQDFSDKVYSDNARARLVAGRDDPAALHQLVRDLTEDGGYYTGKLDADKTNSILSQVQVRLSQLDAKADTDARRGEAAASRVLTAFERQIASTIAAPVEVMAEWAETVQQGTPEQQAEFQDMLRAEIEVRELLAKSPLEQRTALEELRARQRVEGATVQQQANAKRLEAAVETNLRDLREQPLVAYSRLTGDAVAPLPLQTLADGDVTAVQAQLAVRADILTAMREQYGHEVGASPLLPQEAQALSAALGRLGPQQSAEFFGVLSATITDPTMYRAAMQQIAPDSPVRAMAGMIFAEQRQTTLRSGGIFRGAVKAEAGDVARTMLEGESILNKTKGDKAEDGKGKFPVPPPSQFTAEIETFVGTAFAANPEAYELAEQAVRAYYVGRASRDGDVSGVIDSKRVQEAVRAVLGEPVDVGGADVFPPWGMEEDDFLDRIEAGWTETMDAIPAGFSRDLDDYQLRQVGGNTYRVVGAGGAYLYGADGQPVTLVIGREPVQRRMAEPGELPAADFSGWRGGARGL